MTHNLKNLLKPEQAAALAKIKTDLAAPMTLEGFVDAVIDPLTVRDPIVKHLPDVAPALILGPEPVLGVDVVDINGTHVDLRGDDPWFVTVCVDCRMTTKTLIAPEGVDLSVPRVVRCNECAKAYLKAEQAKGKAVRVIHDPRVAKHEPRIKDGIDRPVEVKHIIEKEMDVNLSNYSIAQLATLIERAQDVMRSKAEEALAANVKAALVERAEAEATDQALLEVHRESRSGYVLPAFEIKGVEVPALDLSEITDMSTVMPAKQRSPYNKALYRTGSPIVEADKATYEEMAKHHEALREVAGVESKPKAKKAKGKKAEAVKITAAVEPKAKAKFSKAQVAALAEVRGISKGEARALLESI